MSHTPRVDWRGREFEARVDGPAHGGEFVLRYSGRVVFVSGVAPGEFVRVRVDRDPGGSFCRAELLEVLSAAPERREPVCAAAAAGAGCCDYDHLDPAAARALKGRVLAEQLDRIGGVRVADVPVAPLGDGSTRAWRTSTRWVVDAQGRPGLRAARSHEVVCLPCAQVAPELTEAVTRIRLEPGSEVLGELGDDGRVTLSTRTPSTRAVPPQRHSRGAGRGARGRAQRTRSARPGPWRPLAGDRPDAVVTRYVADTTWALEPGRFWQGHRAAPARYAELVGAAADAVDAHTAWDLYGGAGALTAGIRAARPDCSVTVVESAPGTEAAVRSAFGGSGTFGGSGASGTDVTARQQRVEEFLTATDMRGPAPDLVVLDPPRSGAGAEVMAAVAASGARRVVHVGCDAAAFARDVGALVTAGWQVVSLTGFDAFPGTHHVEAVAVLDPPPGPDARSGAEAGRGPAT